MRHKVWRVWVVLVSGGLLWAQYSYELFFQQVYQRFGTSDSLDIYLCIRRVGGSGQPDTLASSNFPFFYNTTALNFNNARILYRNKFHDNNYYAPLTYSVSGGRVNVTVQRRIGFTPPGHALDALDTIIALRVPLLTCGLRLTSSLVWDTLPAAVLNHQLQNLKSRINWRDDTLPLCPPLSATASISPPSSTICENTPTNFDFTPSGSLIPDSFLVQVQVVSTSLSILYPGIVSSSGNGYTFTLTFHNSGPHTITIIGVDRRCQCEIVMGNVNLNVERLSLQREFYGLTTPACVGDTIWLNAEGSGVWLTPNGLGTFTDTLDPKGAYVSSPNDPPQVEICWVIRSQDLGACRDPRRDTLCLTTTLNASDASGAFSIPPAEKTVCFGGRVKVEGIITSGSGGFWFSDNGRGTFYPRVDTSTAYYVPAVEDVGSWIRVSWIVRGATCGTAIYTDSLFVEPGTQVRISAPNRICERVALGLAAVPAQGDILWFRGSVSSVLASGGFNQNNPRFLTQGPTYEAGVLPVGRDTFVVYLRQGSCESIDEFPVEVVPSPRAAFDADPRVTTMNNPRIRFVSQSQGASGYIWDFGDLNRLTTDSTQTVVEHIYRAPGTYSVVLYVENELGCSDFYVCTDCIQILPRRVYLPNAFSPNGDGKNDAFRVLPLEEGFRFTRLEVFDRWGQPVFAGDDLAEWKGEGKNGQPLDPGAYSYRAVILIPDEGLFTYTGVVHIVR